ncbi:hypothetical protein ACOME3_009089 [Neoechinorhynchus agilis]
MSSAHHTKVVKYCEGKSDDGNIEGPSVDTTDEDSIDQGRSLLAETTSRLFTPLTPSINILVTSPPTSASLASSIGSVSKCSPYTITDSNTIHYGDVCWIRGSGVKSINGRVVLTTYRLLFIYDTNSTNEENVSFSLPYGCISRIEKMGGQTTSNNSGYGIEIFCKDIRHICLSTKKTDRVRKQLFNDLYFRTFWVAKRYSPSGSISNPPWPSYAAEYLDHFLSMPGGGGAAAVQYGWNVYKKMAEFERMRLPHDSHGSSNGRPWSIEKNINENYEFCCTYPNVLVIPASFRPAVRNRAIPNSDSSDLDEKFNQQSLEDSPLWRVREHRSKHRIPVLSWYNARNHAALIRSAQPMTGILSGSSSRVSESEFDKNYLAALAACNPTQSRRLYIV